MSFATDLIGEMNMSMGAIFQSLGREHQLCNKWQGRSASSARGSFNRPDARTSFAASVIVLLVDLVFQLSITLARE